MSTTNEFIRSTGKTLHLLADALLGRTPGNLVETTPITDQTKTAPAASHYGRRRRRRLRR